ncbi:MAG: hypothetical protein ACTSXL_00195 [Alphaproteobacteria bacterium]
MKIDTYIKYYFYSAITFPILVYVFKFMLTSYFNFGYIIVLGIVALPSILTLSLSKVFKDNKKRFFLVASSILHLRYAYIFLLIDLSADAQSGIAMIWFPLQTCFFIFTLYIALLLLLKFSNRKK